MSHHTHSAVPSPIYFNRELSWLCFNRRVLEQALTEQYPLLERLRFLAFVSSNLDEFFEIRVAGLLQQADNKVAADVGPDNMEPHELLTRIHTETEKLVRDQYACWHNHILPRLAEQKVLFKTRHDIDETEAAWLENYYEFEVRRRLSPLGVHPSHPFPHVVNKQLNILVWLDNPDDPKDATRMAIVPVTRDLTRVLRIGARVNGDEAAASYIFLSDVIKHFANRLFPGYPVKGAWAFRITRNSDLYIDEEEVTNLLKKIEEQIVNLKKGAAVRLEIESGIPADLLKLLIEATGVPEQFVFQVSGPINPNRLMSVCDDIDRPDLKFRPFTAPVPPALRHREKFFEAIAARDHLLHHPYDSYTPVVDFIQAAAEGPQVFAIKQTLYRTSGDSPIVQSLIDASAAGKQVIVLVEVKARFDEQNNIRWARKLEEAGVHVVYGMVGLKTHCKCCLAIRREANGIRSYVHLGTGNYNPKTSRLYTDLSLFTAREDITGDVENLFNTLTGFARTPKFNRLLVAPFNLHTRMGEMIDREAENARAGRPAHIIAKVNSLVNQPIIDHLYAASQAGVKIDLIVRGICGIVPGVPGLSENIRVISLLGRYLEHSRIFHFANDAGGGPETYIGSADWMPRNLYRRIECVFPILDPALSQRIIEEILPPYFKDNQFCKELQSDGAYTLVPVPHDEADYAAQPHFLQLAEKAGK